MTYTKARITKQKMPYNPYNKSPFGITTWAKFGEIRIRIYQGVNGDILEVDIA